MKNIAVVLSGCGFKDGAEITEAVSTLIALSSHPNVSYKVFAPDIEAATTNHINGESGEVRNLMVEASRISRGEIEVLSTLKSSNFDAVVFPGGFGVALHLCNWAQQGPGCSVNPEAERVIKEFHSELKPIGAICIAPALVARVLGSEGVTLTIGNDKETAAEIEKTGAKHENCIVTDYVTDRETKVVSTPAYMFEAKPAEVFEGISKLIKEVVEMA